MDRYLARINHHGKTQRERQLNVFKQTLANNLPNAISCKEILINGNKQSIELVKTNDENIKVIHSLPDETFNCGDYILHNNNTYLITKVDLDDEVYTSGKMQLCNYTLTFQHKKTGAILSYPCIKQSSNISTGIDEGKVISVGNALHTIKLPFDEVTKLIDIDDRFFVDDLSIDKPLVYAVSKPDRTTYRYGGKGIIELTMKQDQYDSQADKINLGVCDYFEVTPLPPVIEGYSYAKITCSNPKNELTIGGSFRTLTPTFYNADDTVADNIASVWEWILPSGKSSAFTIIYDGNLAKIKVASDYDLIGEKVIANVTGSNGGYGGEIELTIMI